MKKKSFVLKPNTDRFKMWVKPPVKIYRKYYFFNVENSKEVLQGAKPILTERGPYVYSQILEKRNVQFLNPNTVKYNPVTTLQFDPSLSIGHETDILNILNVPLIVCLNIKFKLNFILIIFSFGEYN